MTMKLDEIVIYVRDVPGAVKYYRDVLGLPITMEEDGIVELDAGGPRILLHDFAGETPPPPLPSFYSDDIEADAAALDARGANLPPVVDEGWGRIVRFTDPEGNRLAIEQPHEHAHD